MIDRIFMMGQFDKKSHVHVHRHPVKMHFKPVQYTDQLIHSLLIGIIPFPKASNKLATTTRCVLMLPTRNNGPSIHINQTMLYMYVYTIDVTNLSNKHSAVRDLIEFADHQYAELGIP